MRSQEVVGAQASQIHPAVIVALAVIEVEDIVTIQGGRAELVVQFLGQVDRNAVNADLDRKSVV